MTETNAATPPVHVTRGQIAAAVAGNALEFYDFATYALFAAQIGRTFFPVHTAFENLMLSLLTFAVGFVGRPVGAVVIGAFADRAGRKPAMLISFTLMGVGLAGLVLIPPYAKIGAAAPALLVLCRLIQGFALGGEVGPTTAFLIEAAPPRHRGLIGAWQGASQGIAALVGASVGLSLSLGLTHAQLDAYGWRIAFALGLIIIPFGLFLRKGLPETLHAHEPPSPVHPTTYGPFSHARPLLLGLAMIMSFTTSTYILLYMTTFASQTLHMSTAASFGASVTNGICGMAFGLAGGALSDRLGRKPVMITARCLFVLAAYPVYSLIISRHDVVTLIVGTALISGCSSLSGGVALTAFIESLRKDVRGVGMGTVYAIAVSVFGGVAQPLATWLMKVFATPLVLPVYMMVAGMVGLVAMILMKESRPSPV